MSKLDDAVTRLERAVARLEKAAGRAGEGAKSGHAALAAAKADYAAIGRLDRALEA